MPKLDHFEIISPIYDRLITSREPDRLKEFANLPTSGSVLDAGGGTGRVSQYICDMASDVVVADLSLGMLKQAYAKTGLYTVCTLNEALPFNDEYFERVIIVDVLHHVYHQKKTAEELWRVLKPGGRIVVEEPNVRVFSVKIVAFVEKLLLMRSHFLTPKEIMSLFEHPNANIYIRNEGYTSWVIIIKKF